MALLSRLLDWLGIYSGETWKQLAAINAAFAGAAVASVFTLIRNLTGRPFVDLVAALFHLGSVHAFAAMRGRDGQITVAVQRLENLTDPPAPCSSIPASKAS
jgi:hypothetical protein